MRLPTFCLRHDYTVIARHQIKDRCYDVLVCTRCKHGHLDQEVVR